MMPRDSVVSGGGSLPKGLEVFQEQTMYIYIYIYTFMHTVHTYVFMCTVYAMLCYRGVGKDRVTMCLSLSLY